MLFLLLNPRHADVFFLIRAVELIVRSDGQSRADPAQLLDQEFVAANGCRIPLRQIGVLEYHSEEPVL